MSNALQFDPGNGPLDHNRNLSPCIPRLSGLSRKRDFRMLPSLNTDLRNLPRTELPSPAPLEIQPMSFETVATAICTYRVALLNFESSDPEAKEANGRALDEAVKAVQEIFDSYDHLPVLSRQLVGVFLKELHYEGTKARAGAACSQALPPSDLSGSSDHNKTDNGSSAEVESGTE